MSRVKEVLRAEIENVKIDGHPATSLEKTYLEAINRQILTARK